ncbi:MAG TPA: hypothetical protein VFL74_05415 [Sphingomicrobium sp.]|nr:hypothetical protein [Sphingomicrobium sp.]
MIKLLATALAALVAILPAPAIAQATNFTLVNNTDIDFSALKARRFGTQQWMPLTVAPVPVPKSGGQGAVQFNNPDCAFDLEATLPDGRLVVWPGVNLCDAKVVTLNRSANGDLWVDYR